MAKNYPSPIEATTAAETTSSRYQFHSTQEVIQVFDEMGFNLVSTTEARTRKPERLGFQKHHLVFQNGEKPTSVGDSVLQIGYISSHDGTSASRILSQVFRKACSNGLIAGVGEANQWKVKHVGSDFGDRLGEAISAAVAFEPIARNNIVDFTRRMMSDAEKRGFAAEMADFRYSLLSEREILNPNIEGWLKARRFDDQGDSLWMTMNVVQEKAIRGGVQYLYRNENGTNRSRLKTVTSIDVQRQINEKVMEMALARI